MHLVPAGRRMIDGHRACEAIAAIGDIHNIEQARVRAERFALLADPAVAEIPEHGMLGRAD